MSISSVRSKKERAISEISVDDAASIYTNQSTEKGEVATLTNARSPLFHAVEAGDVDKIKSMLLWDANCIVSTRDRRKNTALHVAASSGRVSEFELLHLHAPELLSVVNDVQKTAAHTAAESGHVSIIKFIADKDPSLMLAKGALGATPGHLAAIHGHLDVIRFLTHISPSSLSARDRNGSTLVHYAAQHGHTAVIAFAHSCRPVALLDMNNSFHTPVHLAALAGRWSVLEFGAAFGRCVHETDCDLAEEVISHARTQLNISHAPTPARSST
jgi:ankyrin repeat protein